MASPTYNDYLWQFYHSPQGKSPTDLGFSQSMMNDRLGAPTPMSQAQWASSTTTSNPAADAQAQALANKQKLYGLAQGNLDRVTNDPVDVQVLSALQGRMGNDVPYNQTTINALLSGQSDSSSAAENASLQRLSARGGSVTDPSFQAARDELEARRQLSNQAALQTVNQNANIANYNARGQAIGQLGGFEQGRNAEITDSSRYLGGLYQQEQFNNENQWRAGGGAQALMNGYQPSFQGWQSYNQQATAAPSMAWMQQPQQPAQQSASQPTRYSGTLGPGGVVTYSPQELQQQGYSPPRPPVNQPRPPPAPNYGMGVYGQTATPYNDSGY